MENLIREKNTKKLTLEEAMAMRQDKMNGMDWWELRRKYRRSWDTIRAVLRGDHPVLVEAEKQLTPTP